MSSNLWPGRAARWGIHNLDLLVLLAAAAACVLLDIVGGLSQSKTLSVLLALMAVLAVAQLRSRQSVEELANSMSEDSLRRLLTEYPSDLEDRRSDARDLLLIGNALRRTSKSYARHVEASLRAGARVRILVTNPAHASQNGEHATAREIVESITTLTEKIPPGRERQVTVRLLDGYPPANFNVIDPDRRSGSIVVGYHEFAPEGEAAPILDLRPADGAWFQRARNEAQRLWDAGTEYSDLPAATRAQQES